VGRCGGGGRTVELLVYIIHVSIPWKCCHKLSLKLECLVDSVSGEQLQEKVFSCAFVRRKACGRKRPKAAPLILNTLWTGDADLPLYITTVQDG